MELKIWFRSIPHFTRTYMVCVTFVAFCITYRLIDPEYIVLDLNHKSQVRSKWQRFGDSSRTFSLQGSFPLICFFSWLCRNNHMKPRYQTYFNYEKKALQNKRYAEFTMMIIYTAIILIIFDLVLDHTYYLSFELLFSFIYVECKRNPEQLISIWGLVVRSNNLIK